MAHQFFQSRSRGPIYRGPICEWPNLLHQGPNLPGPNLPQHQKVRGPIYRQIGEGPDLLGPNLHRTSHSSMLYVGWMDGCQIGCDGIGLDGMGLGWMGWLS